MFSVSGCHTFLWCWLTWDTDPWVTGGRAGRGGAFVRTAHWNWTRSGNTGVTDPNCCCCCSCWKSESYSSAPTPSTGHVSSGTVWATRWWRKRERATVRAAELESHSAPSRPSWRASVGSVFVVGRGHVHDAWRGDPSNTLAACVITSVQTSARRSVWPKVAVPSVRLRVDTESCQRALR